MEIAFSILLLVVPVIAVVAFAISLVNARQVKAMRSLLLNLIGSIRGEQQTDLDRSIDNFKLGGI